MPHREKNTMFPEKLAWSIGIFFSENTPVFSKEFFRQPEKKIFQPRPFLLTKTQEHTIADPFLFVHSDSLYIFYESQNKSQLGQINAFRTKDLIHWEKLHILKENFHLSFPFVFTYSGKIYLIPESFHKGEIILYEFEKFPDKLRRVKQLIKGKYSDTVFYQRDGVCYLFSTNENNELVIFHSEDLFGEWKPHTQNPITNDKKISRNGGSVFEWNGNTYRIAQDFSRYYGEKVQLLEITSLSRTQYQEVPVNNDLVPKIFPWNHLGTHHFSHIVFKDQHVVAVDGLSNVYRLRNILSDRWKRNVKHKLPAKKTIQADGEKPRILPGHKARIKYRPIDLHDDDMNTQVNQLLRTEFGIPGLKKKKVWLNTQTTSSFYPSLYMGAFDDDRLVGFNAFISHDLYHGKELVNCYQSCWIATQKDYRGQNIFSTTVKTAMEILRSRGAHFIFSFPNAVSRPIFLGRLGFTEYPSLKLNITCIPFMPKSVFSGKAGFSDSLVYTQNDFQLINLKKQESEESILVERLEGNMIWGKLRSRPILGLPFRYFDVGGIEITNPEGIYGLFEHIKEKYPLLYIQIITTRNNTQNGYFRNFSGTKTNDLIILTLDGAAPRPEHFNFYAGIKDVF